MEILKFPHPALLTPCKPVTVFGPEIKVMLDSMFETMVNNNGIGLAANQVGLDYRMFVMLFNGERLDIINPEIIDISKRFAHFEEGCLSAPGVRLDTLNRAAWINTRFFDSNGASCSIFFGGLEAVCFQHEMEHLKGKAFFQSKDISKNKRIDLCKKWGLKVK